MKKRSVQVTIGLAISLLLVYLSVRKVDFSNLDIPWDKFNYVYLWWSVLFFSSLPVIRAIRWWYIMLPIKPTKLKDIIPITTFGYMAVLILPVRLGEVFRPFLVNRKYNLSFSTALSSIVVERVFEIAGLLIILMVTAAKITLPDYFASGGLIMAIAVLVGFALMYLFYFRPQTIKSFISFLSKFLPQAIVNLIGNILLKFVDGFASIKTIKSFVLIMGMSLVNWIANGLAIYALLKFFNMELPFVSSFVILTSVLAVISLPTAPGFIGNFQYGCILALTIFQINKEEAFVFAMIYYIIAAIVKLITGGISMFFIDLDFSNIRALLKQNIQNAKGA